MGRRKSLYWVIVAFWCLAVGLVATPVGAVAGESPSSCTFGRNATGYDVRWTAVTGIDKYIVRRSVGPISSNTEPYWQAAPSAASTSYSSSNNHLDEVQYFVSTKTGSTESPLTACRLLAPKGVSALAVGTSNAPAVKVSWTADPDASVGYNIYTASGSTAINSQPVTGTDYTVTQGLARYSNPAFRVKALSRDPRGSGTIVESDPSASVGAPGTPTLLSATPGASDGTLSLAWTSVSDAQLGYNVFRDGAYFASTSATTFTINAPGSDQAIAFGNHSWSVKARANGDFQSVASNPVSANVADTKRPSPPGGLTVNGVDRTSVDLGWKSPDQTSTGAMDPSGFASYRVYRDTDPNKNRSGSADEILATVDSPSARIDGLAPALTYNVYVTVFDGAGNESYISNKVSFTTENTVGQWKTEKRNGRWEIVDPGGQSVQWEAVNVRGHNLASAPLGDEDIASLAQRFNHVRLNMTWSAVQPQPGPISTSNSQAKAVLGFLNRVGAYNQNHPDNQVGVILDFAHFGNSSGGFWIPNWAWDAGRNEVAGTGSAFTGTPVRSSWYAWAGADKSGSRVIDYIDALADYGIIGHPAVVALEYVNEPHPRPGTNGAATSLAQQELAEVYSSITAHIRTTNHPGIDNDILVVVGAYHGGTRFGGVITNNTFAYNHMASISAKYPNVIWTAHSYYTGYGDTVGRNDGQNDNGSRGGVGWAENPSTDIGCYSQSLLASGAISTPWACPDGFPNRNTTREGLRNTAYWNQRYAQEAGMPFLLGEWGVPRQRYISNGYRGIDGSEAYYCDAFKSFDDPDNNPATSDPIHWAVWSFDASVDGFGLYMARSSGEVGKDFLAANQWADTGAFPASQKGWQGQSWNYAQPFRRDAVGCRQ